MALRKIVRIDGEKCDGCGLCVPSCAEGAIKIVGGKARLVSDTYCDGLGACLGECPRGAIAIEEREAAVFDQAAVDEHLSSAGSGDARPHPQPGPQPADACPSAQAGNARTPPHPAGAAGRPPVQGGCPGSAARSFDPRPPVSGVPPGEPAGEMVSQLSNWPVQLMLVPTRAPYYQGADLLVAADCAPFAFADFHRKFSAGKTVAIGCPKLDDSSVYVEKLSQIIAGNDIRSVHVVHMEVPCCFGLVRVVEEALSVSGKKVPLTLTTVTVRGDILGSKRSASPSAQL